MTTEAVKDVQELPGNTQNQASANLDQKDGAQVDVQNSAKDAVADSALADKKVSDNQSPFGDDWRKALAGDDESDLKRLQRLSDPKALWKKTKELEKKLSSGDVQFKLPENATPEEKAEWRKQQGIPETAEGYKLDLGKYAPSEEDIPVFEEFKKYAHENDLPSNALNTTFKWYLQQVEKATALRKELDESYKQQSEDVLREQWGADYRGNTNVINNFLSKQSESLRESLEQARLGDGTKLIDSPEVKKWLAETALEINPMSKILPLNSSPAAGQSRIAEIEKIQRTNYAAYSKDLAMQEEYYQLIAAQEKINARN